MWKIADIEKNKIKYFENAASGKTNASVEDEKVVHLHHT